MSVAPISGQQGEAMQDLRRLLHLVEGYPFVARVRFADVAGAEHDRRNSDRRDL